jgi:transaldolase
VRQVQAYAPCRRSLVARAADSRSADDLRSLLGQAAVANARRAYRRYQQAFGSERWSPLRDAGARVQRVLWASTSTKNPAYSDVLYVEELIGRDTVNTLPLETLEAFRDHGRVAATLTQGLDQADELVRRLAALGIDLDDVGEQLSRQGVDKFTTALDGVLATVEERRSALLAGGR